MKNLKKFLAIFLSIAMVMCSTLPSFASANDASSESTEFVEETHDEQESIEETSEDELGETAEEETEESSRGELEESDETRRGELGEPAEEETEESESDYAEEPEEDETTVAEEESEEDETTVAVEESEEDETTVDVEESEENETTAAVEESEEDETTAVAEEETSDNNVGASTASPEEETESTVGNDILSSHDETTESLSELKATKSELVSKEELLGDTAEPWMYYYIDGDTIHFTNTYRSGATGVTYDGGAEIPYSGFTKSSINKATFDTQINAKVCPGFFKDFENLSLIDKLENLLTGDIDSMYRMFYKCKNLEKLDISKLNLSKVQIMDEMFYECSKLDYIDFSGVDTSNAQSMKEMFCKCSNLQILDLSSFDTSSIQYIDDMFTLCSNLETIIVSDKFIIDSSLFDRNMFFDCKKLVGCYGKEYVDGEYLANYAHIDEPGNPGYFSKAPWMYWYLTDNDTTIHFTKNKPASGENGLTRRDVVSYKGLEKYNIDKAIFEDEIEAATCARLFSGFAILEEIINLDKYKVGKVTSMKAMFSSCLRLEEVDLSSFNTSNVEYMERMFENCSKLMTIIISSNFVTTKVSDSGVDMFENCHVLIGCNGTNYVYPNVGVNYACLDSSTNPGYFSSSPWMYWYLSDSDETIHYTNTKPTSGDYEIMTRRDRIVYNGLEDTQRENIAKAEFDNNINAVTCSNFFQGFSQLKNIVGIEKLNTSNVVRMDSMFEGCSAITMLDLNSFNTSNVELMKKMFYGCSSLMTIIASDEFRTTKVSDDGADMFSGCNRLVGCYGTDSSYSVRNKGYARIDSSSNNGYFSSAPWMYWYLTDSNQTIHYTSSKPTSGDYEIMTRRDGIVYYGLNEAGITKAEFDNNITAATCEAFFVSFSSMNDIVGLNKLNTQNVNSMVGMFADCLQLDSLDLSNFNTSNVTSMEFMFYNCSSLTSLDLNKFDTSNVTNTQYMFYGCSSLTKIRVSNSFVTTSVTMHNDMFASCTNLVGGAGTTYDNSHRNIEYARIDGGTAVPGYFTDVNWMYWYLTDEDGDSTSETIHFSSYNPGAATGINCGPNDEIEYVGLGKDDITKAVFENEINAVTCREFFHQFSSLNKIENLNKLKTGNVTTMNKMFRQTGVSDLDLKNFDTSKVLDMSFMFCQNNALKELDLRSLDTSNVERMTYMFNNCTAIEKILVSSSFVIVGRLVDNGQEMFTGCTNLVGGAGTTYDGRHTNKEYARIDGGPTSTTPGYFTLYVPPAPPTPPAPYNPGGSSGRGGSSGGGGGGGGGPVTEDAPGVTYLPYVKSIVGFANNLMSKWSQDAMSSKWKLSVTAENGSETNLKNGFILYTHISTQIVGNETVPTAANNTYVFDENGNMITGWVHTADGKIYFFENKKTSDEGKMIIGWKQIQGDWYCFGPDGEMYTNTVTPDGYPVGPDGKWRG